MLIRLIQHIHRIKTVYCACRYGNDCFLMLPSFKGTAYNEASGCSGVARCRVPGGWRYPWIDVDDGSVKAGVFDSPKTCMPLLTIYPSSQNYGWMSSGEADSTAWPSQWVC